MLDADAVSTKNSDFVETAMLVVNTNALKDVKIGGVVENGDRTLFGMDRFL